MGVRSPNLRIIDVADLLSGNPASTVVNAEVGRFFRAIASDGVDLFAIESEFRATPVYRIDGGSFEKTLISEGTGWRTEQISYGNGYVMFGPLAGRHDFGLWDRSAEQLHEIQLGYDPTVWLRTAGLAAWASGGEVFFAAGLYGVGDLSSIADPDDRDADGVADDTEAQAPNGGDGNFDGVQATSRTTLPLSSGQMAAVG